MLVAFSGLKGSGKDTAAKVLIEEYGFTKIAFADPLREALFTLNPIVGGSEHRIIRLNNLIEQEGYEKAKRENTEFRRLMQVFGTEVGRQLFGENVWVDALKKRFPDLASSEARYVVTDCRFINEAKFVDDSSGSIIWIDRFGIESDGHASESAEVRSWRNWLIVNDGTIQDLRNAVCAVMEREGIERSATAKSD